MSNSDSKTVPSDEDVNIIEPCFKKLKSTEETAGELICRTFEGKSDSLPTSEPFKEKCDSVDSSPIVDECVEKPEETPNTNASDEIHDRVETDIKCDASENKQNNGNLIDPVSEVCVTRESTQTAMSSDEPESVKHDSVSSISLGEWAIKSTSFIGPSCKPPCEGEEKEIEDKLSQFYKELEQIEPSDTGESGGESSQTRLTKTNGRNNTHGRVDGRPNSYSRNTPKAYYGAEPHQNKRTNRWHNGRCRPNFNDHVEYPNWNNSEPFYGHQWQPHQSFIVPRGPPYPRFNTPPFNAPPQDHFYHQDGQPFFNNNYDCNWDGSQMYDNSYYSHYDGQGACYGVMQGCSDGAYSPDGYEDHHNRNDSDFHDYGEGPWPQPFEPRDGNGFPYEQHQQRLPYEEEQVNSQPVLILLRGVPGSGKSTLAKELLSSSPDAVVLSTDDYFSQEEGYSYEPSLLGDAHEWNKKKAGEAMDQGKSPVIIDNTNTQAWEMKPYVELALERGYRVEFHEPDTSWKFDPVELEKRNKHGVPQEKIAQMLERFEHPMSIDIVLNSQEPSYKNSPRPPSRHKQRNELKQKSKGKGRHNRKRKRNRRSKPSLNKESEMITEKNQSPSESEVENSEEESLNNGKEGTPTGGPICKDVGSKDSSGSDNKRENCNNAEVSYFSKDTLIGSLSKVETKESTVDSIFTRNGGQIFEKLDNYVEKTVTQCSGKLKPKNLVCICKETVDHNQNSLGSQCGISKFTQTEVLAGSTGGNVTVSSGLGQILVDKELSDAAYGFLQYDAMKEACITKQKITIASKEVYSKATVRGCHSHVKPKEKDILTKTKTEEQDIGGVFYELATWKPNELRTKDPAKKPIPCKSKIEDVIECAISLHVEEQSPAEMQNHEPRLSHSDHVDTETSCSIAFSYEKHMIRALTPKRLKRLCSLAPTFQLPREMEACGESGKQIKEETEEEVLNKSQVSEDIPSSLLQDMLEWSSITFEHGAQGTAMTGDTQDTGNLIDLGEDHTWWSIEEQLPHESIRENVTAASEWTQGDMRLWFYGFSDILKIDESKADKETLSCQPDIVSSVTDASVKTFLEFKDNDDQLNTVTEGKQERCGSDQDQSEDQEAYIPPGRFPFVHLRLSKELALQLVELFGPPAPGVDSFLPEDYDVSLDWELSEAIHSQWKKSLEERHATTTENYLEVSAVSEQRVEEKETSQVGFEKSGGMDTDKLWKEGT
ncbi:hypothetical protein AOXY_G8307 [Acipenser oxyrinchus oxyrinchus]|uniref:DUF7818 domain-containing protein n=1 Tax=Acipenser oxyrinchus oxyrinchus TaxID=40147 RepID=A0AAD8DJ57_ACIOX|nr:hypothetical protein AOXY_G8307 [Acipenser oxyrinchus oxyrinchus]